MVHAVRVVVVAHDFHVLVVRLGACVLHFELAIYDRARCVRAFLDAARGSPLDALRVAAATHRVRAVKARVLARERLVLVLAARDAADLRRDGLHMPRRARAVIACRGALFRGVRAIRARRALRHASLADRADGAFLAAEVEVEAPELRLVRTRRAAVDKAEILPLAELIVAGSALVALSWKAGGREEGEGMVCGLCEEAARRVAAEQRASLSVTHVRGAHVLGELARRARGAAEVSVVVHAHGAAHGRSPGKERSRPEEAERGAERGH